MKLTRVLLILVVIYVGYKYVWPKVSASTGMGGGSAGGGRRGGKSPAGRSMTG